MTKTKKLLATALFALASFALQTIPAFGGSPRDCTVACGAGGCQGGSCGTVSACPSGCCSCGACQDPTNPDCICGGQACG